ncbi:DUF4232 domain-containing protein [Kineococcus sp. GCM10028916]|uniref:DUF4232 domain-containing protein n=1 Tax=Kineococcus sp. GCM10028916 TaxID=3273394 RepID=UPI00364593B6
MRRPSSFPVLVGLTVLTALAGCSAGVDLTVEPAGSQHAPEVGVAIEQPRGGGDPVVAGPAPTGGSTSTAAPTTTPPAPTAASPTNPGPTAPIPTRPVPSQTVPSQAVPSQAVPTQSVPTQPVPTRPGPTGSTPPSVPSPAPTASAPVTSCTTAQLVGEVSDVTAGTGTSTATVVLTNTSELTCRVRGFGGISLGRSDGVPVLSRQVRSGTATSTVTLTPGRSARSTISWSTTANTAVGEPAVGDCEAVPTSLRVIPPDQIAEIAVPWSAGPVCDQGTLTQSPYTGV